MTNDAGGPLPRLGFVGLGLMGLAMTVRLLGQGYQVTVSDREPSRVKQALAAGARGADSPSEVVRESEIVLACVTDTKAVEDVVFSPHGVASAGSSDKLFVDHSTSDAEKSREMAKRLEAMTGMGWVDAPVSGGPEAARTGSLALMCGGSQRDVDRAKPVFRALARNVTHMGPTGAGQVTKMVNQVLTGVGFATLAEALRLAENAGIAAARIPECLAGGYGDSMMLQRVYPRMATRDFVPPSGLARQMLKDLELVSALARATNTATPMADQARELYRQLTAHGFGELDTSSIVKLYDS
jgi:3-hydroxyisobutyrate dehydrogenase